jgi:LPPG:FO 2-phospho-L-lactate transferase
VGLHYGARSAGGVLDGWLVESRVFDALPELRRAGLRAEATPLLMTDDEATAAMARVAMGLVS